MKKILYDCDPGIDDALAILLAVNSGKIKFEGISCVHGNSSVDQTTLNALRILDYIDMNVPVAKGAGRSLALDINRDRAASVHGNDGLGDSKLLPKSSQTSYNKNAVDFILEKIKSGTRTIVATGALTNIALAFQKDPETMNLIDKLIIMGGVINEPGNIDRLAEANFFVDPHAADFVLQQKVKKILVPLNVTRRVIFTPEQRDSLPDSKIGKLVKSIVKVYQDFYMKRTGIKGCPLHDPLAMGVAISPGFVKTKPMDIRVETDGKYTRGVCVPELRSRREAQANVDVALEVDSEKFLDYFLKTLSK